MNREHQFTLNLLLRYLLYSGIMLGVLASLPYVFSKGDMLLFRENGPIEWIEFSLAALSAITLTFGAVIERPMRGLFSSLAAIVIIAAIREMDGMLDNLLPGSWKWPAFLCVVTSGYILHKYRSTLLQQLDYFVKSTPFGILWVGFIVVVVMAQLVGNGKFLEVIMGDDYNRIYKRVIEEISEMFGYLIIFFGTVEAVAYDWAVRRKVFNDILEQNVDLTRREVPSLIH